MGNCRDFSTMLCTVLRYQNTPARARCGFGAYFLPDHYEDHWGFMSKEERDLSADDLVLLDHIAVLTVAIADDDKAFPQVRALFENDARLRVPPGWPLE